MGRHSMAEHTRYERLYGLFLAYAALLALFGLTLDTPAGILRGLSTIILTEDALITDYVLIAGPGAALVNSALVTAISTLILRRSGEPFNGFSPVVVGLMSGFSLFGKNFVNIWPILLGTFLYAKSRREPVGKYARWACWPPPCPRWSAISPWTTAGEPLWPAVWWAFSSGLSCPPCPPIPIRSRTA